MTDDNARYRSSDPFAHAPDQGGHGSDPLAELARLIGQNDPFADRAREQQHPEPPRAPQPYDDQPAHDPRYDAPYPADPAPHFAEPAPLPPEPAPVSDWQKQPPFDPFAPASSRGPEPHAADRYQEPPPQRTSPAEFSFPSLHSQQARLPNSSSSDAAPSDAPFAAPSHHEPAGMPSPPFHLASGRVPSPPPLDEYYDDAPQGGRRRGLITVAAVFMLAVVGTAGAFGYRTWFGGPSVKPAPAVIRASAEPAKVAPPAPAVDPNANKISYDRFGDRGQNEKVVLREEKPVDIRDATRTGSAMSTVPLPGQQASAATPNGGTPPSVLTDPKRVRTVTIRPDAPDNSIARPPMVTQQAPAAPVRQAAVAPSSAPLDLANPASPPQQARAASPSDAAACGAAGARAGFGQCAAVASPGKCPAAAARHRACGGADPRSVGSGRSDRVGQRKLPRAGFVPAQRG